jgi:hypothetical protein
VGVKRPGLETEHSFSSSAEIKNSGAILPLPHTCKSSWRSTEIIKHREYFTSYPLRSSETSVNF